MSENLLPSGYVRTLPQQLEQPEFRFCLIRTKSKAPYELEWQRNGYAYDDPRLTTHIQADGNFGVIGGYGNLRIIDIDVKNPNYEATAAGIRQALQTFEVRTGSGGSHFYVLSDYGTNHVFLGGAGEFRANNYQVVGPGCIHPNGNRYEVTADLPIVEVQKGQLVAVIAPLLRPEPTSAAEVSDNRAPEQRDHSKSGREFAEVCQLVRQGKSKEDVFRHMQAFAKWSTARAAYREMTYSKALTATTTTHHHPPPPTTTQNNPEQPNSSREFRIKSLLLKPRPTIAQLKSGIKNGIFYIGTTIYEGINPLTAVITSDRRLFVKWRAPKGEYAKDEIREDFGLYYRYDFLSEVLDSHWSSASINAWLYDDAKPRSLAQIFESIRNTNRKFMIYPDEKTHDFVALDILSTYFLPCFEAKGRTFMEAEKGSGKTRQATVYKLGACNSIMSADITKAAFFRVMESTCSTLIIDDFDSLSEEQKTDVLQHYRTGYKNTSKTVRVADDKSRRLDAFRNYGHVVMNNTGGLGDVDADRTIFVPVIRMQGEAVNLPINETASEWSLLRDECFLAALTYWADVRKSYQELQSSFSGRQLELARSILSLATCISPVLKDSLETWLKERFGDQAAVDVEGDWTYLALSEFAAAKTGDVKKLAEIAENIALKILIAGDKGFLKARHGIATFLGKMFRRLPVFRVVVINGARYAKLLNREAFERYLEVKGGSWLHMVALSGTENRLKQVFQELSQITNPVPAEALIRAANERGFAPDNVDKWVVKAKSSGDIYEPKPGFLAVMP